MNDPVVRLPAPLDAWQSSPEVEVITDSDPAVCWFGRLLWVGIVTAGLGLGGGVTWLVLRALEGRR